MFSNNKNQGGCGCGCGGSCGRSGGQNSCQQLGPFTAIDQACIVQPTPGPITTTGSIIPFSSGTIPVVLTSTLLGLLETPSLIGFGTATPGVAIAGTTLDLTTLLLNEAFSVPRDGNITAISASFTATAAVTLLGTTTVVAQIYKAPAGSTVFTATGATVNLAPSYGGVITIGQTSFASANVAPIPVVQGDRLVMVYSIVTSGVTVVQVLTGTAGAGITIA